MSDFVIDYEIMNSAVRNSWSLAREANAYADSLNGIAGAIKSLGPSSGSGNLDEAEACIVAKIQQLHNKANRFNQLAEDITTLIEKAETADNEVMKQFALFQKAYQGHNHSSRINNILSLFQAMTNKGGIQKFLTLLAGLLGVSVIPAPSLKDEVRKYYQSAAKNSGVKLTGGQAGKVALYSLTGGNPMKAGFKEASAASYNNQKFIDCIKDIYNKIKETFKNLSSGIMDTILAAFKPKAENLEGIMKKIIFKLIYVWIFLLMMLLTSCDNNHDKGMIYDSSISQPAINSDAVNTNEEESSDLIGKAGVQQNDNTSANPNENEDVSPEVVDNDGDSNENATDSYIINKFYEGEMITLDYSNLIPEGWKVIDETSGDLNEDGFPDLALVLENEDLEETEKPHNLLLAFGNKDTYTYKISTCSDKVLSKYDEYLYGGHINIDRNSIFILQDGKDENVRLTYQFQYSDDEWYLIGADKEVRGKDVFIEATEEYNYITGYYVQKKNENDQLKVVTEGRRKNKELLSLKNFDIYSNDIFQSGNSSTTINSEDLENDFQKTLNDLRYFEIYEDQTFLVDLENWGKVQFVPGITGNELVMYLADNDGNILGEFPAFYGGFEIGYSLSNLEAVAFRDVNNDGLKDVIVIANCMTGVGPNGADEVPITDIYFQQGKKFVSDHSLDEAITFGEKLDTINEVVDYMNQITPTGSISDSITDAFDMETFKSIVTNVVNDDLWYRTPELSNFHPFESHTMDMEIYNAKDDPSSIWAVFNDPVNNKDRYFGVEFEADKRGFLNEINVFFSVFTHQEAESMMGEGFTFYEKTKISFGEATKPIYPETTSEKEVVINGIMGEIIQDMEFREFSGTYTIYICNFRDNSIETSAVIVNSQGKKWLMDITIYDDGDSDTSSHRELDTDTFKQWTALIMDNAVRVEDVTIEQE